MSKPRMTEQPTLTAEPGRLVGHNGGWLSESGPVTEYLFRFVADGVFVKGAEAFVSTSDLVSMPGQYPADPDANILSSAPLTGRTVYVEVSGGTISDMSFAGGGKVIEWGDPARSNTIVVSGSASPAPPSAAAALLEVAIAELLASTGYKVAKAANPFAFESTHIGKSLAAMRAALALLR